MPCATNRPPCGRADCAPCFDRSLFARKAELAARKIECMLSDADMRTTSSKTPVFLVAWMCMICYHAWEAPPGNVVGVGSGCPYCGGTKSDLCGYGGCTDCAARSLFAWKEELAERGITCGLSDEQMLRTSRSSTFYVPWTCSRSKHTWKASPNNACAKKGRCCGYCEGGKKTPCGNVACALCMARSLYACKEALADRKIESLLDDDAMKTTARGQGSPKLPWRCLECENEWKAKAHQVIGTKSGCPTCGKTKRVTEKTVREAVHDMDLGDVEIVVDGGEWEPEGGVDGNVRYRFDIRAKVFEDDERPRSFVVEVDGEQHFGPVFFSGSTPTDHDKQMRADIVKMVWAFERDIPIVRVPTCVVAWGSTERESDWIAKLTELCREAVDWRPSEDESDCPLFIYSGKEWMYAQHVEELEEALSDRRSKRARCE